MAADKLARSVAHLAIAVHDLDQACAFWRDLMGATIVDRKTIPEQKVELAFAEFDAGTRIELLMPTDPDSPVGRFMAKNGPGLHHVCLRVEGIEDRLIELKSAGIDLVDTVPRGGAENDRIAFLHPKSTHSVLIELSELTEQNAKEC